MPLYQTNLWVIAKLRLSWIYIDNHLASLCLDRMTIKNSILQCRTRKKLCHIHFDTSIHQTNTHRIIDHADEMICLFIKMHQMNAIRQDINANFRSLGNISGSLSDNLIFLIVQDRDLMKGSFKYRRQHLALKFSLADLRQNNVFRTDHRLYTQSLFNVIHTIKLCLAERDLLVPCHNTVKDIAFSDKIRYKSILWLIVDLLRRTNLLNLTIGHDNDLIRHGKCFLLIVRHKNKCDAKLFMH